MVATGYVKRNSIVQAVQVTAENLRDVRLWCKGGLSVTDASGTAEWFITVPVVKTNSYDNKPKRAFVGNFIVLDDDGYKIYREADFFRMYDPIDADMIDNINKRMDEVS